MSKVGNKVRFIPISVALVILVTCHTERVAMVTQIHHLAFVGQECNVDLLQSLDELRHGRLAEFTEEFIGTS